jgi:hypothetical protein
MSAQDMTQMMLGQEEGDRSVPLPLGRRSGHHPAQVDTGGLRVVNVCGDDFEPRA